MSTGTTRRATLLLSCAACLEKFTLACNYKKLCRDVPLNRYKGNIFFHLGNFSELIDSESTFSKYFQPRRLACSKLSH